jgi:hypothetical protein
MAGGFHMASCARSFSRGPNMTLDHDVFHLPLTSV